MDGYKKQIAIVAVVIIILILGLMYYMMEKAAKNATWPPFTAPCPDYWIQDPSSGICQNPFGLGSFSGDAYQATYDPSNQSACCNYLFATQNQLAWDGLTYGVNPNPSTPLCPPNPVCSNS